MCRWNNVTISSYRHITGIAFFPLLFSLSCAGSVFFSHEQNCIDPMGKARASSYHWWTLTRWLHDVLTWLPSYHLTIYIVIRLFYMRARRARAPPRSPFTILIYIYCVYKRRILQQCFEMTLVWWDEMRACGFKIKHSLFPFACLCLYHHSNVYWLI